MAHLLTDCENLVKSAWKEVTVKPVPDREKKIDDFLEDLEKKVGNDHDTREDFEALKAILREKAARYKNPFTRWKSCKQLYESLRMLLQSDYRKTGIIDIGNAQKYLDEAKPLYLQLSGKKE